MVALSDTVSIWTSLSTRSSETEWLDEAAIDRDALDCNLRQLETLNRVLGGHQSLVRCFIRARRHLPTGRLRVVDVGCGSGDGLRVLSTFSRHHKLDVDLVGLDLNAEIIETARARSAGFPNIRYIQADAFGGTLEALSPDLTVATLFCHHFPSDALRTKVDQLFGASRALVISDLHRHPIAHAAFRGIGHLFHLSPMTRHDGAVSIRRGFTRRELEELVAPLGARHTSIRWAFAFRYEVLLAR
jgi:SAM-dependent methyltransferase